MYNFDRYSVFSFLELSVVAPSNVLYVFSNPCNLVYKIKCPQEHCLHSYIGETARRLEERILEHSGKDKNSSVFKHSLETGHDIITLEDTSILASNFGDYKKRKIAEALFIKNLKPTLNEQNQSIPLSLLN